ncbi:hypothetical protein [Oceanobacillus sp. J11TS1]|uniref:hypothetical protein n=1 Tax=Oceanobacillus sp. J11TS1 TaxID=2807191 RepID=UPI001B232ED3|nr:hypothetical protein [Oceanobacillus sp. J11TS1]GIO21474.1 hypothetical protein J11TS1_00550 [Oceanobacillus sp. J11TS1]
MNVAAKEIMRKAVEAGKGMDYYTLSESKVYQGKELMEHSILENTLQMAKEKQLIS